MCTLTYLPLSFKKYIITSNRDEDPKRKTLSPREKKIGSFQITYPMDAVAGGTWIAHGNNKRTGCLLNGAFETHQRTSPYRLSRGIMVLQSFEYENTEEFIKKYDFRGIEPFTYVGFEIADDIRITELRWDGKQKHVKAYDPTKPHIWSSPMLYKPEVIEKRRTWFKDWVKKNQTFSVEGIMKFHLFGGEGEPYNDVMMNRDNKVKTVSITSIETLEKKGIMIYYDLIDEKRYKNVIQY